MSLAQTPAQLLIVAGIALLGVLLFVVIVAAILLRTAKLEGKVDVLLTALSVEYEEETRHIGPVPVATDYRVKARLSDAQLGGFGLEATPSQRLRPSHPSQRPPLHPYAIRPEGRTPPPGGPGGEWADSWPQGRADRLAAVSVPLGYGTPAPVSQGLARRMSGGPGPNSRGLHYQTGGGQR